MLPDRPTLLALVGIVALELMLPANASAESPWRDPHPQRLDGFVDGREFLYNSASFINRFSYRQLSASPAPGEDGLSGTGGSISGDELYLETNLQKTLYFDNDRYGIIARVQRREDFDGRFDRQLLGVVRRFGEHWQAAFSADVSGDKGDIDFQYEAIWHPDEHRKLRMAVVQVDRLYNNKGNSDNKYQRTPVTLFAHYQQQLGSRVTLDMAVNYSPHAQYEDHHNDLYVRGDQLRVAGSLAMDLADGWQTKAAFTMEETRREVRALSSGFDAHQDTFARRMHSLTLSVRSGSTAGIHGGLHFFSLDEQGWFGSNLATSGFNQREEVLLFAGMTLARRASSWWEPTLTVGAVDVDRQLRQRPADNRRDDKWQARLTLPWRYVVHQQSGAVLTLNPTLNLDSLKFGGGNIQLHWPF
jgi:hypothetical protein